MIDCDSIQVIIKDILTIPEHKPDIEKILRATCTPKLSKVVTKNQFTLVCGELNISIEYVASVRKKDQPVFFTSFKKNFADVIKHRHVPDSEYMLSAKVEYEEFNAVSQKTINSFIILNIRLQNDEPL